MAYVIAGPCVGTKDTACVDACPVDCIHPKMNTRYDDSRPGFDEVSQLYIDLWNASIAVPACRSVRCQRFFRWRICPRNGSTTPNSTRAMCGAADLSRKSLRNISPNDRAADGGS
jgi:hypothetical protein